MWDQIWKFALDHYIFHTIIIAGLLFLIFGKYNKILLGKNGFEIHKDNKSVSKIEKLFEDDVQERKIRQAEVDKKFDELDIRLDELKKDINETNEILLKVSEDTQYSIFIEEKASIDERLKAFRILIALERNGDVKKGGFGMVLDHKDIWKMIKKIPLPVKIKNQEYYDETMKELDRYVFDKVT